MRARSSARTAALLVTLVLLSFGCVDRTEHDQLAKAHKHLKVAKCGSAVAVAGVASVNLDPQVVYLGDWIVVSVCNLDKLVHDARAQQQPITLYIEGIDSGNEPSGIDIDAGVLTFILDRNDDNKKLWAQYLYNPLFDPYSTMHLTVGIRGERPLPRVDGAATTVRLKKLYFDGWTALWFALLLLIAVALVLYARNSPMLRNGPMIGDIHQPYSLGRSQMAWWFLLTLISFVYIWLVTGDRDSIPPSLLGLMGISAATAFAAAVVSRGEDATAKRERIDSAITDIDTSLAAIASEKALSASPAVLTALTAKQAELQKTRDALILQKVAVSPIVKSDGWWRDLVTDDRGSVALDRLQVVVWTIILGGIFLESVVWELTMPEFNATLLTLMGISSGTYIGFKLPGASSTDKT